VVYNPLLFALFLAVMVLAVAASLLARQGGAGEFADGGASV
jgi:ethanolamine permease